MRFCLLITHMRGNPNIGVLYDCNAAILKGVFAAPSEKKCIESLNIDVLTKFEAEVRKYQQIKTKNFAYHSDENHVMEMFWACLTEK